jgi:hypothetical protein
VIIAYADPPYPGCAHKYKDHPDYAGEVDHLKLAKKLADEFDGFILHTNSTTLRDILPMFGNGVRVMAWVKPFAAFKRNVPVAYAWEPVIVRPCRKPVVGRTVKPLRDFISHNITMKKGLCGVKPEAVCHWAFEVMGANTDDELVDLFPGTGAVTRAWESWRELINKTPAPTPKGE